MTDEHRHRAEVTYWMHKRTARSPEWLRGVLDDIERHRGKPAADRLRADIAEQWAKRSKG